LGEADSLAAAPSAGPRDRALVEWARNAAANDLAWLLRRAPAELGGAEPGLLDAALAVTPASREALRQRWLARPLPAARRAARKGDPALPELSALRPYASVFRVAAILPDSGEYAAYAWQVRAALVEGLAFARTGAAAPIELDSLGTGDSDPTRVAAAL